LQRRLHTIIPARLTPLLLLFLPPACLQRCERWIPLTWRLTVGIYHYAYSIGLLDRKTCAALPLRCISGCMHVVCFFPAPPTRCTVCWPATFAAAATFGSGFLTSPHSGARRFSARRKCPELDICRQRNGGGATVIWLARAARFYGRRAACCMATCVFCVTFGHSAGTALLMTALFFFRRISRSSLAWTSLSIHSSSPSHHAVLLDYATAYCCAQNACRSCLHTAATTRCLFCGFVGRRLFSYLYAFRT